MEKDDKRIEEIVEKLMSADSLEKAPEDFTFNVMSKIEALSTSSSTTEYTPLIPKYIWWILSAGFVALIAKIILGKSKTDTSVAERYNLPEVSFNFLENLSVDFSNTLLYASIFLAVMVCIQIPLLKQYFDNRLSY
ncbi:MAG: hypothetical protein Wins2KO_14360 [Winogradskyella sp.]|uniref:hypothetical protein n=1 Tax=Winogradskyella sp. TaxID=1883156 RepID=UPI0025DB7343|nr:hypothetical protein [Winogradskyella sp.]NRB58832.1 hypothetical protein [Winogradskyella sp.]